MLVDNGLDDTLSDLLMIVHQAILGKSGGRGVSEGIAEVVAHIGVHQFAARIRATDQLRRLYLAWRTGTGYDGGILKMGYGDGGFSQQQQCQQPQHQQQQPRQQDQNDARNDGSQSSKSSLNHSNNNHSNSNYSSNNNSNNSNSSRTLNSSTSPGPCTNSPPITYEDHSLCGSPLQYQPSPGPCTVCGSLMTMMERYCLTDTTYQY